MSYAPESIGVNWGNYSRLFSLCCRKVGQVGAKQYKAVYLCHFTDYLEAGGNWLLGNILL